MLFDKIFKDEPIDRVCTFPCLNIGLSYAKCSSALVYSIFLVMFRVSWNSWKVGDQAKLGRYGECRVQLRLKGPANFARQWRCCP